MRGSALLCSALALAFVAPAAAAAQSPQTTTQTPEPSETAAAPSASGTGGLEYGVDPTAPPRVLVPGTKAVRLPTGFAAAPAEAPVAVQAAVFAANEIVGKPYRYGGGHNRKFKDSGYDCSGTVSYAFRAAGLLKSPLDSGSFMRWGKRGKGKWITVYANPGHAYTVIAGLRLDTSAAGEKVSSGRGPRWRSNARKQSGFVARHAKRF